METKATSDRVFVIRIKEKDEITSGIIIPDTANDKQPDPATGNLDSEKCIENGKRILMEVKKCDHMLFGAYADTTIKIDVVEYLIKSEDDNLDIIDT